jgi:hypothetical protein
MTGRLSVLAILAAAALIAGCTTTSIGTAPGASQQQTGSASAPPSAPGALPAPPVCGRGHAPPNCPG